MEKITIDADIGTITANAHGNLLLMQLIDAFKDKVEIDGAQKVLDLITKGKVDISEPETTNQDEEIVRLEDRIDELENELDSTDGLTEIDCGYGSIWWKSSSIKLQGYMEELTEKLQGADKSSKPELVFAHSYPDPIDNANSARDKSYG